MKLISIIRHRPASEPCSYFFDVVDVSTHEPTDLQVGEEHCGVIPIGDEDLQALIELYDESDEYLDVLGLVS